MEKITDTSRDLGAVSKARVRIKRAILAVVGCGFVFLALSLGRPLFDHGQVSESTRERVLVLKIGILREYYDLLSRESAELPEWDGCTDDHRVRNPIPTEYEGMLKVSADLMPDWCLVIRNWTSMEQDGEDSVVVILRKPEEKDINVVTVGDIVNYIK